MDARDWETSHTYRSSSKRPWESYSTSQDTANSWPATRLPPIEPVSYSRSLPPRRPDPKATGSNHQHHEDVSPRNPTPKKVKYDGSDTTENSFWDRQNTPVTGTSASTPNSAFTPTYRINQDFRNSYDLSAAQGNSISGSADGRDMYLRDVRRQIAERPDESESCSICCRDPDLALVTQAAAAGLIQLVDTFKTGKPSKRRTINPSAGQEFLKSWGFPLISEHGLRSSLEWMLGKITQINQLADSLFENRPLAEYSQRNGLLDGPRMQDALDGEVKRRYSAETDRGPRAFDCVAPTHSHSRTRSPVPRRASNDDYSIVKSKPLYCAGAQSTMNPPPAPGRQLPSSPGRQLPSPTSVSFPSPSAVSYSSNISPNTTPLTSSQQSTSSTNLPSLAVGLSGDSAIQAHSAALQHEVSIQKIALSSLQGEHDKLLAAFSRSQTRSSALEKKHAVSDGEIINLTEEKLRLQQQVVELERDVEDLTRSRDEFRQAAVQESAQYIEIVKKATHLEQMTGEERKAWKVLKREFEQKIDFLESRRADELRATGVTLKIEGSSSDAVVAVPPSGDHSELLQEVRRLRSRCTKAEDALRAVRADAERLVGSLNIAGRSIMEQVDSSLVLEASAIPGDNGRG